MAKIQTLHMDLEEATNEAHEAKTSLAGAKDFLAVSGLKIVALYRRRQQYRVRGCITGPWRTCLVY
jgi:hypothetical protein